MKTIRNLRIFIYIVAIIITIPAYLFYFMIWEDNNTIFTVNNVTTTQKETIADLIGITLPEEIIIEKINYRATWGNDTIRTYEFYVTSTSNENKEFSQYVSDYNNEDIKFYGFKTINTQSDTNSFRFNCDMMGYGSFENFVRDKGIENTSYKRNIAFVGIFIVLLADSLLILPYGKINKRLKL